MSRDDESLIDIYDSAQLILSYCKGISQHNLGESLEKQDAILRRITVIGEATKRLSPKFRAKHNHIPWRKIAGMRDVIVHEYDEIDFEEIWMVITENLPQLIKDIKPLLP
jgi:uncharacterized protein with HEPN domain